MQLRTRSQLVASAVASLFWLAGCAQLETDAVADATGGDAADGADGTSSGMSCVGCHTDEEALKAVLPPPEEPKEEVEGTGEG